MDTCTKSKLEECQDKPVTAEKNVSCVDDNGVPFESKTYYMRIGVHAAASLFGLAFGLLSAYLARRQGVKTGWFYSLFDDPFGWFYTILYVEYSITYFRPSVQRALDWRWCVGLDGKKPEPIHYYALFFYQGMADYMLSLISFRVAGFFWKMDIFYANETVGSLCMSIGGLLCIVLMRLAAHRAQSRYKEFREAQEQEETGEATA